MNRIVNIIGSVTDIASGYFTGLLISLLMLLVLVEVLSRYVAGSSLALADEYGSFGVVAITLIGLAYTWKEKGHTRIEFMVSKLPPRARNWLRLIIISIAIAFIPVLLMTSIELVAYSYTKGARTWSWLRTPLVWPQTALIVGYALLLIQAIAELTKAIVAVRTPGGQD